MILVNIKRLKEGNFYKLESHLSKLLPTTTLRAPRRPFILFFLCPHSFALKPIESSYSWLFFQLHSRVEPTSFDSYPSTPGDTLPFNFSRQKTPHPHFPPSISSHEINMLFSSVLLATFASSVSAYSANGRTFAVNHFYGKGPLVEGRMDPIVDPGNAAAHVHSVQGGNNFALTMTDGQALASTCTSSLVKNDKSNYWTPKLYFQFENGSFVDVPMFYMNVYYL